MQDSSSVIQFVTRSHVQIDSRAMEVSGGLPEDISVSSSLLSVLFLKYYS